MPTTYTHWYFGNECIKVLPDNLKQVVNNNRDIFNTGTNGPDVFFYNLLDSNVTNFGHNMHKESPREFFNNAIKVYRENDQDKDAMLSYLLGFLSHYVLDSQTHSYVERKREVSNLTHNKVEAEYDGYLMRKQGYDVRQIKRADTIFTGLRNAEIISRFYPFDGKTVHKAFKWHKFIISIFHSRTKLKYHFLKWFTNKFLGEGHKDIPVPFEEEDICKDSNLRLDRLSEKAIDVYKEVVDDFMNALNNNKELGPYFDHHFNQWDDYKDIEILSYEDELNNKI